MPYSLAEFNRRVNTSGESRETIRKAGTVRPPPHSCATGSEKREVAAHVRGPPRR